MGKKSGGNRSKRPPGPLGPWRLSIVVLVSGITTGSALLAAATTGVELDIALARSFGVAFLVWVALGKINLVLGQAEAERLAEAPGGAHLRVVPAPILDAGEADRAA